MPQLDFFTVNSQVFCLLLSIFFIYSFLLKYALPAYDVFLRLKLKKVIYYRLGVENLFFLSLRFKESSLKYVNFIGNSVSDFSKVYFNFLISSLPVLYFSSFLKSNKIEKDVEKPFRFVISNSVRPVLKDNYSLKRKKFSNENLKGI